MIFYFLLSSLIFLIILILDVYRFNFILDKFASFQINSIFKTISLTTLLSIFIPFRISDIFGIFYLNYIEKKISFFLIFATYFIIRLIDAIIIILIVFLVSYNINLLNILLIILPILFIILFMLNIMIFKRALSKFFFHSSSFLKKEIQLNFLKILWTIWNVNKKLNFKDYLKLIISSLIIWSLNFLVIFNLLDIFNLKKNIFDFKKIFYEKYVYGFTKAKIYNFELLKEFNLENSIIYNQVLFIPICLFLISLTSYFIFTFSLSSNL